MSDILAVPLKKTSDVDLVKPLKNLISLRFSTADKPEDFGEAINETNKLRNQAVSRILDKNEASIEIIARYCDQLAALETKIPPQDVQISFKWKDAFDRGSLFGTRASLAISSLAYERVCSLFNLAAMQSQVASVQSIETDESLKLAAKLLQQSAGIFTHLKTSVISAVQQEPTQDLNPETLTALSLLMIAQAQEMFVLKAINDKMKEAITAKLAAQCEENYSEALKAMQRETVKGTWDREWVSKVNSKQAAYQALAQFYQSQVCNSKKNVGEEIARLQFAVELFKTAQLRAGEPSLYQDYIARAQRALAEAEKDNNFIYHERIPDIKSVEAIGKAPLAKIIPLPEKLSLNFRDLFDGLTPVAVHQSLAAWEVRKAEIVNGEIGRLREASQLLNGILASLNLPAALEESAGETLPQSLKDKARAVREAGGITKLEKIIHELPSLLQRNQEILDESERLLKEEKGSDDQLRAQFKERWNRTPSDKLTETFRTNLAKYKQILTNAVNADAVVRSKFESHRKGFTLLSSDESQLENAVPSATQAAADNSHTPAADKLRSLMSQVENLKAARERLESEFKSATVDMKSQFLRALAESGAINEAAISVEKLGAVYGPLQKEARESILNQESLLDEIQRVNLDFTRAKSGGGAVSAREELLKQLAAAHDAFMELQGNLEEGTKFYNDLTQLLITFQSKISDFCFARKAEKEELLKDLTSSLANQRAAVAPPTDLPSHHTTQPTPPARPPPPNFAPATQSAPPQPQAAANPYAPYPMQVHGMPMPQPYYAAYNPAPPPPHYNPYGTYPHPHPPQGQQQPPAPPGGQAPPQPPQPGPYGNQAYPGYPYPYYNPAYPYPPQQQPPSPW